MRPTATLSERGSSPDFSLSLEDSACWCQVLCRLSWCITFCVALQMECGSARRTLGVCERIAKPLLWPNRTGSPAVLHASRRSVALALRCSRYVPNAIDATAIGVHVADVAMERVDYEASPVIGASCISLVD